MVESTNLKTRKQQTRSSSNLMMLNSFEKGSNIFSGLCEQTNKVQCMYLAFETIKITTKKDQQGKKAEKKVRMMFLKIKMKEVRCC